MNKDEMIEEIKAVIVRHHSGLGCDVLCDGDQCENCYLTAKDLYYEGYRKVADDEIVLKQSEVDEFRKDQAEAKFLKDKIKKETAREILRLIYNRIKYKESANPPEIRIVKYAAKKYGIELGE